MSDVSRAKTRRASARGKITKLLKNIDKLLSDNGRELHPDELQRKLSQSNAAIAMAKVKGATIGQVAVALTIRDFDDELAKEWAKYLGPSNQIPDVADLMKFVRPLSHNLPSNPKFSTSSQ